MQLTKLKQLLPLELVKISRFFFFVLIIIQAFILAGFQAHYKGNGDFYGLAALFFISPIVLVIAILRDELIHYLWLVWVCYSGALVIMTGVIFGGIVIPDQLKNDTFFGPNVLKTTLSFTPPQMLLLLNSVTDEVEILKELYFTATLNLFDGIEMLEVLLQDTNNAIPTAMRFAVLTAVILFFAVSFLEIFKEKIEEDGSDSKPRKRTVVVNDVFQIGLNLLFLLLRLILWFAYEQESAIFIAKNVILLLILILPYLEAWGWITTES